MPIFSVSENEVGDETRDIYVDRLVDSLLFAVLVVTHLSMNQQHCEVHDIEICHGRVETGRERPRQSHEEVSPGSQVSRL